MYIGVDNFIFRRLGIILSLFEGETMKKNKRLCAFFIVIFIILIILFLKVCYEKEKTTLNIECNLQCSQNVVPVLYYENFTGLNGYDTNTFIIEDGKTNLLEKHYRTWSKTYPSSALEKFGEYSVSREKYGQLMIFYSLSDGDIFVFDRFIAEDPSNEYYIIKDDVTAVIPYDNYQSFFDFLQFNENYYLFTFLQTDPTFSDFDVIRIYKFSKKLELEETFDINYRDLGLLPYNFINKTIAIVENILFAPIKKENKNYFLKYDLQTREVNLLPVEYKILGIIADKNCFHSIGLAQDNSIIFESFTPTMQLQDKNITPLPFGFEEVNGSIRFDKIFYQLDSNIYFCFKTEKKCYFISYNIASNAWTNWWVVEKNAEPLFPMDVKYMVRVDDSYYDLFPYCNNGN